jgi:pantoate--beta-alanine ligase
MRIIETISDMRRVSRARPSGKTLGLVPTMGALHEGHLSLVRAARTKTDQVAVSIFVNPTQFGPNEDFAQYPRTFERDCELLRSENVDVVFAPSLQEMYPEANITWVEVQGMSERLCGKSRPGHFRGVTTVVAKLFHMVEPDFAFFGQKDAAQVAIIRRMVRDLNMPVGIETCPIMREPGGLAMSSRNAYLSPEERKAALVLYPSLACTKELFAKGERNSEELIAAGNDVFAQEPRAKLEYFEIVDPDTLEPEVTVTKRTLVAVAAFVGNTRLIDNILLEP